MDHENDFLKSFREGKRVDFFSFDIILSQISGDSLFNLQRPCHSFERKIFFAEETNERIVYLCT